MIDFKSKDDVVPSTLIVASLVILTATAIFTLIVPRPQAPTTGPTHAAVRRNTTREAQRSTARAIELEKEAAALLWQGNDQEVTSAVLSLMTERTHQYSLTLASFRPERIQPLPGLIEQRYSAQITGSYLHLANLLAALDASGSKIVLTGAQIAPSGNNSGSVTATIALSAYAPGPAQLPTTTAGGAHGQG